MATPSSYAFQGFLVFALVKPAYQLRWLEAVSARIKRKPEVDDKGGDVFGGKQVAGWRARG